MTETVIGNRSGRALEKLLLIAFQYFPFL